MKNYINGVFKLGDLPNSQAQLQPNTGNRYIYTISNIFSTAYEQIQKCCANALQKSNEKPAGIKDTSKERHSKLQKRYSIMQTSYIIPFFMNKQKSSSLQLLPHNYQTYPITKPLESTTPSLL